MAAVEDIAGRFDAVAVFGELVGHYTMKGRYRFFRVLARKRIGGADDDRLQLPAHVAVQLGAGAATGTGYRITSGRVVASRVQ